MKSLLTLILALSSVASAELIDFESGGTNRSNTRLEGAGSKLSQPLLGRYFSAFSKKYEVAVRFEVEGEQTTHNAFLSGNLAFAVLEDPISDLELAQRPGKENIVHVPVALAAVMPAYNLPGAGNLNFTPEALSAIFLGKIRNWNHPELQKANPGVSLPNLPITLLERADASGVNYILSGYLSKISSEWKSRIGHSLQLKLIGTGVWGSGGMVEALEKQPGSFGYLELNVARSQAIGGELSFGSVQNRSGRYVMAGSRGMQAAASTVSLATDTRQSLADAGGPDSYPISGYTYLVVQRSSLAGKNESLVEKLLVWALEDGQDLNEGAGYGRLPDAVVKQVRKSLGL